MPKNTLTPQEWRDYQRLLLATIRERAEEILETCRRAEAELGAQELGSGIPCRPCPPENGGPEAA